MRSEHQERRMLARVEWRTSTTASALHAAEALEAGRTPADLRLAERLRSPARRLSRLLDAPPFAESGVVRPPLARLLDLTLAPPLDESSLAVDLALHRLAARFCASLEPLETPPPDPEHLERLHAALTELHAALLDALPRLPVELPLRQGPLREQWEARAPGLLARVARRLPLAALARPPIVQLLHPVLGGGGTPVFDFCGVRFEALLTNADSRLPETVRLAWLLVQLAASAGLTALPAARRRRVIGAAVLPAVVEAAQYVELSPPDPQLVRHAFAAWLPDFPELSPAALERLQSAVGADWPAAALELLPAALASAATPAADGFPPSGAGR